MEQLHTPEVFTVRGSLGSDFSWRVLLALDFCLWWERGQRDEQPFSLQLSILLTFTSHLIQVSYLGGGRAAWQSPVQNMEDEDGSPTAPAQMKSEHG